MISRSALVAILAACLVIGLSAPASATPAITFVETTGGTVTPNSDQTVGWMFNVLSPLTVTGLGWFDEGHDGLAVSHAIGLWNPLGTMLATIVAPAGTVAPLDVQYRMMPIAPLGLAPGDGYIIGGLDSSQNPERTACGGQVLGGPCGAPLSQTVDPLITFVDATAALVGTGFQRPTIVVAPGSVGFYGPMFALQAGEPVPVPEPSTSLLLGAALSGLVLLSRRRR